LQVAGFINFYLDPSAKQAVVKAIQQKGVQFGRNQDGQGKKSRWNLFRLTQQALCM